MNPNSDCLMNHWTRRIMCAVGALMLTFPVQGLTFTDDFNSGSINPAYWLPGTTGIGPQVSVVNQRLELYIPGSSTAPAPGLFGAHLWSAFGVGDFDGEVEFELLDWPDGNGARLAIGLSVVPVGMERISFGGGGEFYLTHFLDGLHSTPTSDKSGALRITRVGNILSGYYRDSLNNWVLLHSGPGSSAGARLALAFWSDNGEFQDQDVRVALDNVRLTYSPATVLAPDGPATLPLMALSALSMLFLSSRRK
jgi:hypothetical protein